ncbi:MAG: 6-carboxytetrahydropterin synthase [candidate division WOR-3 bacterium]
MRYSVFDLTSLSFLLQLAMYLLKIKEDFSAAHALKDYHGKCESLHGHNYQVLVEIEVEKLPNKGYLYDFREIRDYLKAILPDHKNLNEFFSFNPTAENIAHWLFYKIKEKYPIKACEVWENENSGARYEE